MCHINRSSSNDHTIVFCAYDAVLYVLKSPEIVADT
jgi:hypothetical protein